MRYQPHTRTFPRAADVGHVFEVWQCQGALRHTRLRVVKLALMDIILTNKLIHNYFLDFSVAISGFRKRLNASREPRVCHGHGRRHLIPGGSSVCSSVLETVCTQQTYEENSIIRVHLDNLRHGYSVIISDEYCCLTAFAV